MMYFLTGTDEHGQKVQEAAEKRNVSPKNHVDEYVERFKKTWDKLDIDYSYFIRTTETNHQDKVKKYFVIFMKKEKYILMSMKVFTQFLKKDL